MTSFLTGNCLPSHSKFFESSSVCASFIVSCPRNVQCRRQKLAPVACLRSQDSDLLKRRAILLMGFGGVLSRSETADAIEGLIYGWNRRGRGRGRISPEKKNGTISKEKIEPPVADVKENLEQMVREYTMPEPSQTVQEYTRPEPSQMVQENTMPEPSQSQAPTTAADPGFNPLLSIFNSIGVLSSGVLASLYASTVKEKANSDATMESIIVKLKEKEAAINTLEKEMMSNNRKAKVSFDEELAKANEERLSLINQLTVANEKIKNLEKEVQKEKNLVKELNIRKENLEENLMKFENERRELQKQLQEKLNSVSLLEDKNRLLSAEIMEKETGLKNLGSEIAGKEEGFDKLSSEFEKTRDQIRDLTSEIRVLEENHLKYESELELKNLELKKMNVELNSLLAERDEYSKRLEAIVMEFKEFKSMAKAKEDSDSKSLEEKETKLSQMEDQLKVALEEAGKDKVMIADLIREKDRLGEFLDIELKKGKNFEQELKLAQETLQISGNEVSDMSMQLQQTRNMCSELQAEISKIQAEFTESRESLEREILISREDSKLLTIELNSANECLDKTNEKLQIVSQELAATEQKCDSLDRELENANKTAESAASNLSEVKKIVSSLTEELKEIEAQISRNIEVQRTLEADLEDASKSIDNMNQNEIILLRELDYANSKISSLEDEKVALFLALNEQKQASQEASKTLADSHSLITKLGNEMARLDKRAKKLEEELAYTKGEMLRLRSQMSASNDRNEQTVEAASKSAFSANRRVYRRRTDTPQEEP